jgi:DNA mismatch repair ATPase MutS
LEKESNMITPLKQLIAQNTGIRFITNKLEIQSPVGRKYLLQLMPMSQPDSINQALNSTVQMLALLHQQPQIIEQLKDELSHLHDIEATLTRLSNKIILDDVQLFEIKWMTLISNKIKQLMQDIYPPVVTLYDLTEALNILDPAEDRLPHFYIYPLYDERLALLHKKIAAAKEESEAQPLKLQLTEVEDEIRGKLTHQLSNFHEQLAHNLRQMAILDLFIAKATLADTLHLCKPAISNTRLSLHGLFNPMVADSLQAKGSAYQPIDIELFNSPSLLTGANMSGKSVLLKTIGIAQYLFQYGFFVPAASAEMMLFDEVMFSIGDQQSEMNGLSSFAVEILNINAIIKACKSGKKVLALVDELARTTNPEEGKILVSAFLKMMEKHTVCSLISTHYTLTDTPCRHLRIKGLRLAGNPTHITPENITQHIDYSIIDNPTDHVPHEALQIARIFGVDEEFLGLCE